MDILYWAFIFYILGAITRTAYGFLAKVIEAPEGELKFDAKYYATLLISILTSLVAAVATFAALPLPQTSSLLLVFVATFPVGYAINDVTNRGVNIFTSNANNRATLAEAKTAECESKEAPSHGKP